MMESAITDPNIAFLLLVIGLLGVYWELHAPGMMLPGILGVLLAFTGAYGIYKDSPTWYGLTILLLAVVLLMIELKYYTHMISGLAGAVLFAFGAIVLLQGPHRVTPALAIAISAAFGTITIFLGVLGMRARTAKRLSGADGLVGEVGESRTEINPEGTVFVHGEYWRARSDHSIAPGRKIAVERVQDLLLYVKEASQ